MLGRSIHWTTISEKFINVEGLYRCRVAKSLDSASLCLSNLASFHPVCLPCVTEAKPGNYMFQVLRFTSTNGTHFVRWEWRKTTMGPFLFISVLVGSRSGFDRWLMSHCLRIFLLSFWETTIEVLQTVIVIITGFCDSYLLIYWTLITTSLSPASPVPPMDL